MNPRDTAIQAFQKRFLQTPLYIARAPGRVNLLGEHVDYNDGFVLPAAIDRATYIAFSPAFTDQTALVAADFGEEAQFTPETLPAKTQPDGSPLPEWAHYPAGVAWALGGASLSTPAMQAAFSSDIPRGSGLSSSASIEMAFGVAWSTLGAWKLPPMQLALLGQKAENQYVGVNCGIMDQFASACGEADRLMLLDCRSRTTTSVPMTDPAVTVLVINTNVRHKLAESEYGISGPHPPCWFRGCGLGHGPVAVVPFKVPRQELVDDFFVALVYKAAILPVHVGPQRHAKSGGSLPVRQVSFL